MELENIESFVYSDPLVQVLAKSTHYCRDETNHGCEPNRDVSSSRRDPD